MERTFRVSIFALSDSYFQCIRYSNSLPTYTRGNHFRSIVSPPPFRGASVLRRASKMAEIDVLKYSMNIAAKISKLKRNVIVIAFGELFIRSRALRPRTRSQFPLFIRSVLAATFALAFLTL